MRDADARATGRPSALLAPLSGNHPLAGPQLSFSGCCGLSSTYPWRNCLSTTSLLRSAAQFRAVLLCGVLTACGGADGDAPAAPGPAEPPAPPVVVPDPKLPSSAYLLHTNKVEVCQFASDGLLINCVDTQASGFTEAYGMTIAGSHLYLETFTAGDADHRVTHCSIGADGTTSGCSDTGQTGSFPVGLTVRGSTLYLSLIHI